MADYSSRSRSSTDVSDVYPTRVDMTSKSVISKSAAMNETNPKASIEQSVSKKLIKKKNPSRPSSSKKNRIVYIPDAPSCFEQSVLEEKLRQRLEKTQHVNVMCVKYYVSLGVVLIELSQEAEKLQLISEVQSLILDPRRILSCRLRHLDSLSFT